MRPHDALSGWLLFCFGIAVVVCAQTFPPMPGQNVGPAFFPKLIGGGLAVSGLVQAWTGRRTGGGWFEVEEWVRRPRMVVNFCVVVGSLVFYALAVDVLGFFVAAFVFLAGLFFAFGVGVRWIAPLAAVASFAIHFSFYTLLRVPLPWGWLEGIGW